MRSPARGEFPLDIPEIRLRLDPVSENGRRAIGFRYAGEGVGDRSKIGGAPDWIQGAEKPACDCGGSMSFYAQIDSVGDDIILADCGMVYVFICFSCFASRAFVQSY